MSPCLDGRYRSTQSAAISDTGTFATTSFRNNSSSSGVQRTFLFFDTRRSLISPSPSARARPGGGDFGGATEAAKGSRGSDPRLLGLTMGWLLDRTLGSDPVHQGSSMPEGQTNPQLHNTIPQQVRQIETA